MRAVIKIGLCLGVAVVLVTLIVAAIAKTREAAARTQCTNNLKLLGLGLHNYHDAHRRLPTGTLVNPNLVTEKRFSWLVEILPYIEQSNAILLAIDRNKAWDVPENCPPKFGAINNPDMGGISPERVAGVIPVFVCPAASLEHDPLLPSLTSYLGVTGVGKNAAQLPLEDVGAGAFGYERKVTFNDFKHGRETTIMLVESLDGGPWTAGGRATVRGFDPERVPYFGSNGQFASNHPVTLVVMADGSVRGFTSNMSPQAIEAMAALAGDKDLARFED